MKPIYKYTEVAEMTTQVNRLYDLLAQAGELASELQRENTENKLHLQWQTKEAQAEERPLSMQERLAEAKRQASLFQVVWNNIESASEIIGLFY